MRLTAVGSAGDLRARGEPLDRRCELPVTAHELVCRAMQVRMPIVGRAVIGTISDVLDRSEPRVFEPANLGKRVRLHVHHVAFQCALADSEAIATRANRMRKLWEQWFKFNARRAVI